MHHAEQAEDGADSMIYSFHIVVNNNEKKFALMTYSNSSCQHMIGCSRDSHLSSHH